MWNLKDRLSGMPPDKQAYALRWLPAHLVSTGNALRLERLLTDVEFLEVKCSQGRQPSLEEEEFSGVYDLQRDFAIVLARFSKKNNELKAIASVRDWSDLVRFYSNILRHWPHAVIQQAYNAAEDRPAATIVRKYMAKHRTTAPWFRLLNRPIPCKGHPLSLQFSRGVELDMVAMSPSGQLLAASSPSRQVYVWDRITGVPLFSGQASAGIPLMLRVLDEGYVVVHSELGELAVFDAFSKKSLAFIQGGESRVLSIAIDEKRRLLGAVFSDGKHSVLQLPANRLESSFVTTTPASTISFCRQTGNLICCYDADGECGECRIEQRDIKDGGLVKEQTLVTGKWTIVEARGTGSCAAVYDRKTNRLSFWDVNTGKMFAQEVEDVAEPIEMTSDGKYVLTSDIRVYESETGRLCQRIGDSGSHGIYWVSQNGQFLVTSASVYPDRPVINVYDLRKETPRDGFGHESVGSPHSSVTSYAWADISCSGQWLASVRGETVEIWDLLLDSTYRQPGHDGMVTSIAIVNSGRLALSGAWVAHVGAGYQGYRQWESEPSHPGFRGFRVWDSCTGELLDQEDGGVGDIATTPDGCYFAMGWERMWGIGRVPHAGIWRGNGKHIVCFPHSDSGVRRICLTTDGQRLVTYARSEHPLGDKPGKIRIWSRDAKSLVGEISGYEDVDPEFNSSPNCKWLGTWVPAKQDFRPTLFRTMDFIESSIVKYAHMVDERKMGRHFDRSLRKRLMIWDLQTGRRNGEAVVADTAINQVVFLRDGVHIATCGQGEPLVRIWKGPYLELAGEVTVSSSEVLALCPLPDGSRLLAGSESSVEVVDLGARSVSETWSVPGKEIRASIDGLHVFAAGDDLIWLLDAETGRRLAAVCCVGKTCWCVGHPNKLLIGYSSGAVELYAIENALCAEPLISLVGGAESEYF